MSAAREGIGRAGLPAPAATVGWLALAASALLLGAACGPPVPVTVPPAPTASAQATAPSASAPAPEPPPKEILPALHPCVPDFIRKALFTCEPGAEPADYSAVANAFAAMATAGPQGPRPKEAKPVPRALTPVEEKAAKTARAFLCRAPEGELDDEHSTAGFDLGRLYIVAHHYEEAVVFLHRVALLDPQKHAEVEYAARFLLDALGPLEEARPECKGKLAATTLAALEHVCQGPGADQRAESCAAITKVKDALPPAP